MAQETPADTLRPLWRSQGAEGHALEHPRTVRFLEGGGLVVSDVERNSLFRFGSDGAFQREITEADFAVPYVVGTRGDTTVVFNAEANRIDVVAAGHRVADRSIQFERPTPDALVYMLATDTTIYAKVVGQEVESDIGRLNAAGRITNRVPLSGPHWRHAGFLRAWDDEIVSLSGYRPVVHLLPRGFRQGASPDSLFLVGFDSPMLERSYAFARGDVVKAPLLTPASAPAQDLLFVLNLRPGWVQIDAYGRDGRLQHRLVERHEQGDRNFYPLDLDVRTGNEGYTFAVTIRSPEPQVEIFRWRPGEGAMRSRQRNASERGSVPDQK